MSFTRNLSLLGLGFLAGALITVQSVLNAGLGKRTGNLGSVLLLTAVSMAALVVLILVFPGAANLRALPGLKQWHLYLGGVLGILILVAPIYLVPRIGATATLTAIVMGQLFVALAFDHFGLLGATRVSASPARLLGVALVALGAYLVSR